MQRRRGGRQPERRDLIVLGSGAAGATIAIGAAGRGLDVTVVAEPVGMPCLHAGSGVIRALARWAAASGDGRPADRWADLRGGIDAVRAELSAQEARVRLRAAGVEVIEAAPRFLSEFEVLAGSRILTAERFVVATGDRAGLPPIDGLVAVDVLTPADVLELDTLPASLAIVGTGGVAVELAQILARLGVDVTLVGASPRLVPKEEALLADALADALRDDGVELRLGSHVAAVDRHAVGTVELSCSSPEGDGAVLADAVLVAAGCRPNVDDLGLEVVGVTYGPHGVQVDATLATSAPHIWAVGDVTGIYPFPHVAHYQAHIALHNILAEQPPRHADYRVVPWTICTDPELARVGLTEAEAVAGGYAVATAVVPFAAVPGALAADAAEGLVKLVVDRATHQVLGGHILGANAGDLIAEIALAMRHRLPVSALADTLHVSPSMAEAVARAAREIAGRALHGPAPVIIR